MADETKHADDDKKKAARQQLVPNAEGNVVVDVIMGPYRDNRLTMTAADADAAINAHWARDPLGEEDPDHPPLTDQQRSDALAASHAWAQAQQDALLEEPPPAPPEGGVQRRAMKPEEAEGYKTRQAEPRHPEQPKHPEPKHEPPKR
jgi:hypothetical protein